MDTIEKVKKEKNTTTMRNINARFNSFTFRGEERKTEQKICCENAQRGMNT